MVMLPERRTIRMCSLNARSETEPTTPSLRTPAMARASPHAEFHPPDDAGRIANKEPALEATINRFLLIAKSATSVP